MRFFGSRKLTLVAGGFLALVLVVLVLAWFFPSWNQKNPRSTVSLTLDQDVDNFFKLYWQRPIPLQGAPPASFTVNEASLRPEACGSCHTQQYADWKGSLHSKAMGAGPWGQIIDLTRNSPEEASQCMTCHAPLSEQSPLIAGAGNEEKRVYEKNPHFDSQLQLKGITCAACHVRQHQRFGPPKAEGAAATKYPVGAPNHGGVQRTPYFEKAEFCKDCHQFDPENTVLVNGKPIQDTYREWKNSIWGQGEAACQDCHMPGRRHLWKGIHDKEWVSGGVRIEAHLKKEASNGGSPLELTVEVTNAAVGHKFPTYVTPKVFVRAGLLDRAGKILGGTLQEKIIGWDVRSENGEWKEYFDTRILPGESFRQVFRWRPVPQAKQLRAWVEVHPDHFYHVYFYPAHLKSGDLSPQGRKLIEQALQESGRTRYILFEKLLALN